jgi:hypothetical protein
LKLRISMAIIIETWIRIGPERITALHLLNWSGCLSVLRLRRVRWRLVYLHWRIVMVHRHLFISLPPEWWRFGLARELIHQLWVLMNLHTWRTVIIDSLRIERMCRLVLNVWHWVHWYTMINRCIRQFTLVLIANLIFNVKLTGWPWVNHRSIRLCILAFGACQLGRQIIWLIHRINLHSYNLDLCTRFALSFLMMRLLIKCLLLRLLLWWHLFLHRFLLFFVYFIIILVILELFDVLSLAEEERCL